MITFENVTKRLGNRAVLDGLSVEIEKGETFVIVGSSGMGKSVTLKHMVRLMTPDSGRVLVGGECVSEARRGDLERIRERFGYLFQGGALLAWLSVFENVALPLREKTRMEEDEIREKVLATLKLVEMENDGDKNPSEISGGMRKRAGLARAIIRNPEIVLYDEPTSGLDPVMASRINQLIIDVKEKLERGVTSVVVTHDMNSAFRIANRMIMLYQGKMVADGTSDQIRNSGDERVRQFISGSPEGPTPLRMSKTDYVADLLGLEP
jgi:phospholipid/cholesterol/gamma-HCH transport system ATP-binding protein